MKKLSKNILTSLGYICWRSLSDTNFRYSTPPSGCNTLAQLCAANKLQPTWHNVMIISNHNKHPIWEECIKRIVWLSHRTQKTRQTKRKSETCWDPRTGCLRWGVGRRASTRMPSLQGKGRNELIDINGCGFDGGNAKGKKETDGKDEKAEKITHEMNHCQMKVWRDRGF